MFPDERISSYINQHFVPVKIHVKEQPQAFGRFGAQWTPTEIILDPNATERHRFEGFLPADDFLAQLKLGMAKSAFAQNRFDEAEQLYREVVDEYPDSDAAQEALYWAGVSKYKRTGDAGALNETARAFQSRYTDSSWAKRASVWA